MSSDDPDLTLNEPTATGSLRMELYGDKDKASGYTHAGRTVLGGLRSRSGVNERIAQGQGGGFYHQWKTLPDGIRIHATTNDGQDTVQIYATSPHTEPEPKAEEEPEKPLVSIYPYLWIGVRIVSGGADIQGKTEFADTDPPDKFVDLHLCVWEEAEGDGEPVILSNRHHLLGSVNSYGYGSPKPISPAIYPLQDLPLLEPDEPPAEAPSQYDLYKGMACTPQGMFQLSKKYRDYAASSLGVDLSKALMSPYAERSDEPTEFDEVVICDPGNELELPAKAVGKPSGTYHVKVMARANDCINFTPVECELVIVAGRGDSAMTSTTAFTISEFTHFWSGALPKGWFNPDNNRSSGMCTPVGDYGPNPMGPHWWQGGAEIVLSGEREDFPMEEYSGHVIKVYEGDSTLIPPTGFEPGSFHARDERCKECGSTWTRYSAMVTDAIGWYARGGPGGSLQPGKTSESDEYQYHEWRNCFSFSAAVLAFAGPGGVVESSVEINWDKFGLGGSMPFEPDYADGNSDDAKVSTTIPYSAMIGNLKSSPAYRTTDFEGRGFISCATGWVTVYTRDTVGKLSGSASYCGIAAVRAALAASNQVNPTVVNFSVPYNYEVWTGEGERIPPYVPTYPNFPNQYDTNIGPNQGWGQPRG